MGRESPLLWLHDIREYVSRINEYLADMSLDEYKHDSMLRDAVERNIEKISEASRNIPEDLRDQHANLPWRQIADIGNVMRHEYFRVDPEIVWNAATGFLEPLAEAIDQMIASLPEDDLD